MSKVIRLAEFKRRQTKDTEEPTEKETLSWDQIAERNAAIEQRLANERKQHNRKVTKNHRLKKS